MNISARPTPLTDALVAIDYKFVGGHYSEEVYNSLAYHARRLEQALAEAIEELETHGEHNVMIEQQDCHVCKCIAAIKAYVEGR